MALARIRHIPHVLVRRAFSTVGREVSRGWRAQPPGLRPNPTSALANSHVSPVARKGLLTAPSNAGAMTPNHNLATITPPLIVWLPPNGHLTLADTLPEARGL